MTDVICAHCKREISRYITDGPYCSLHCRDLAELDSAEKEVEMLREQVALLREVAEAAEYFRDYDVSDSALTEALGAARKGGAIE